jgi:hypothetical protein
MASRLLRGGKGNVTNHMFTRIRAGQLVSNPHWNSASPGGPTPRPEPSPPVPLRANISETVLVLLINEQGEKEIRER